MMSAGVRHQQIGGAPAGEAHLRRYPILLCLAFAVTSCVAAVDPTPGDLELMVARRVGFENVAEAVQPSCGTLDCHGQATRNLRLFGGRGLRLDPADTSAVGPTTPAEYDATYWAVVALEPEAIGAVVEDGGRGPERLLLIRKARGSTRHKGGTLMQPGDNLNTCLTEWLKGTIAVDACQAAKTRAENAP